MKFPYGISDFQKLITGDYFYVDRTDRIPLLEQAGLQLLFLRPRRFGKSLLLSLLENYYDVARAHQFEQLFGKLAIGQAPTPLHNQYFVLRWDFSLVDPQGDATAIQRSLYNHINSTIQAFMLHYRAYLDQPIDIDPTDGIHSFQSLLGVIQQLPHKLYLLIDEYDSFANEVMMGKASASRERYEALLYGEGTFKTLFKAVKAASSGRGLDRVFITGVSPVVLSDATSGYNVAESIYLKPQFNDLCGFTEAEVAVTVRQLAAACHLRDGQAEEMLGVLRDFYNGYTFTVEQGESLYNPTLVLYFMKEFQERCEYPDEMLDNNLAMDQVRLGYIAQLPQGEQFILDTVSEQQPLTIPTLAQRFGLTQMLLGQKDVTFMASLLYYLGVLTLAGKTSFREIVLRIPNAVVRRLYVERLQELLLPDLNDQDEGRQAAKSLFQTGNLQPLSDFVEKCYFKVLSNRDYRWADEFSLKTIFLSLLFNDRLYIIDSEPELARTYADLTLIRRPEMRQHPQLVDLLFEFKYVTLNEIGSSGVELRKLSQTELLSFESVREKLTQAQAQVRQYQSQLSAKYGNALRLRAYAIVAVGFERLIAKEVQ